MAKAKNFQQAAQTALDDRWIPIVNAKTCGEMLEISRTSNCELCNLQKRRYGGVLNTKDSPKRCGRCGLKTGRVFPCCTEFYAWKSACGGNSDYPKALEAAQGAVKRLEVIAHGTG